MQNKNRTLYLLISIIFFLSGFSSLIYQVVWQRLLSMHYGVGSISTALIVGIYMAGLGLGSLVGGYLAERLSQKIRFYLVLELSIGVFGLASLPLLELLGEKTAGSDLVISGFWMFVFLCIPTLLMGITLPVLTKLFNQYLRNFEKTVSYLYFINTIGASMGALTSSYVLISFFGLDTALFCAVGIDFILALLVFQLGKSTTAIPITKPDVSVELTQPGVIGKWAFLLIGITGFLAIGYEIVWYRFIGVLIKDSPYSFSSILSVYLLGLALGSLWMNRFLDRKPGINKKNLFLLFQFLIGVFVLLSFSAFFYLTRDTIFGKLAYASFNIESHPDPLRFLNESAKMGKAVAFMTLFDVIFWPGFFLLVPTFLMGAGFPLVSSLALTHPDREGSTVGTVYFFNILGNVLGSLVTSFLILPAIGTESTLFLFAVINVLLILLTINPKKLVQTVWKGCLVGSIVAAGYLWFPKPQQLYYLIHPVANEIYFEEGMDSVVLTYRLKDIDKNYINGLEHGSTNSTIYNAWVVDTLSYSHSISDILIIGYGIGTFPEVSLMLEDVKNITVVELSSTLITNMNKIERYRRINQDQRVKIVVDDGRRYLLANQQQYDVILMDPVRSTTAYANNLHSAEFFNLVQSRLKPGGVVFLGGMKENSILPKTFATVFPFGRAYYYCAIGSNSPLRDNLARREKMLSLYPPDKSIKLSQYLVSTFRGDHNQVLSQASRSPINRRYKPHTEYYLGYQLRDYFGW